MKKQGLFDKLIQYGKNGNYGFHMPGHKRNTVFLDGMDPFQIDITEITDFDNLHHAEGVIKESMENAAKYWGTDRTWFLVNGSSCGILAAIHSVTDIGDSIIIGRNCHKAVYNAAAIRDLKVQYFYPEFIHEYGMNGGYDPEKLEQMFRENKNIKAVVITSPTYDGIVSDIKTIADITHKYGGILIVDEAHGAHLGISDRLPKPAYDLGADLVIESVHKTLPCLTQTALLHLQGDRVVPEKVEEYLDVYESSSPSYVLMASIDKCIRQLQTDGKKQMEDLLITNDIFRKNVNNLKYIYVPGKELNGKNSVYDIDVTKLVIYINPTVGDGKKLAHILREKYHFEMEMESAAYVLGITTICDKKEEILRLGQCLEQIDNDFQKKKDSEVLPEKPEFNSFNKPANFQLLKNKIKISIYDAKAAAMESIKIEMSKGRVSGEFLYLYPPGIPLLVPGEVISDNLLKQIKEFKRLNMNINGLKDRENRYINVLKDKLEC